VTAKVFQSPLGAHGLLVPGEGATVSRRGALASLLSGEMGNAILRNGVPHGALIISLSRQAARTTFYIALPPPGKHHNVRRYPIAVVGPGYSGVLTSSSTRLPGLVSIADVAPSVKALRGGEEPRIRSKPSGDPFGALAELDHRLDQAHDSRILATLVLIGLLTVLGLLALVTRAPELGRAAFLAPSSCIAAAVALSAVGVTRPWATGLGIALAGAGVSLAAGVLLPPRLPMAFGIAALFVFLFTVMWAKPEWNTLAVIGPHPDGGGRFYGVTNQIETLLLAPALVLGALAGARLLPVIALAIAAGIAASRIGADGGGLVVYLRLPPSAPPAAGRRRRPSRRPRRLLQPRSRWSGSTRRPADRVTSPRPSAAVPARSSAISATGSTCRRRQSHPPGTRRSSSQWASVRSSGSRCADRDSRCSTPCS
jgi:hypothetical protein